MPRIYYAELDCLSSPNDISSFALHGLHKMEAMLEKLNAISSDELRLEPVGAVLQKPECQYALIDDILKNLIKLIVLNSNYSDNGSNVRHLGPLEPYVTQAYEKLRLAYNL